MKNVNQKVLKADLPTFGGAALGTFASNLVPMATKSMDVSTQKGKIIKGLVELAIGGVGAYGYMAIDGNGTSEKLGQGASLAIAGINIARGFGTIISSFSAVTTKLEADTTVNKAIKATLGLACPGDCNQSTARTAYVPVLNRGRYGKSLRMPESVSSNSNHFIGNSIEEGKALLMSV